MKNQKQESKEPTKQNRKGRTVPNYRREQPRKDSKSKRINLDNARASKVERDIRKDMGKSTANDIGWYNGNPELLKSAGSIPLATILGQPIYEFSGKGATGHDYQGVPGIMALPFAPNLGTDVQAANQTFNSQYSFLVHANSRNYTYDGTDLGLLELAGAQVFAIIAAMVRAYGICKYYYEQNLYTPDALLYAMGFYPFDVRENLSEFWFRLNVLIDQTKQIWVPTTMPIVDRWIWLNSEVYTDAEGITAQMYLYVQNLFYYYDETRLTTGGCLSAVPVAGVTGTTFSPGLDQYTVRDWILTVQFMIDKLIGSQDRGIIYGDILNAYGTDKIRAMMPIDANFKLAPVYNKEVLMQIENTVLTTAYPSGIVQQKTDLEHNQMAALIQVWDNVNAGGSKYKMPNALSQSVLNFHFPEQPTPEMIMVATRNISYGLVNNAWAFDSTGKALVKKGLAPQCCSTEVFTNIVLYYSTTKPGLYHSPNLTKIYLNQCMMSEATGAWSRYARNFRLMAFDWHPFIYEIERAEYEESDYVGPDFSYSVNLAHGDYDHYTVMNIDMLRKLHRTATYSLFGVPQM